MDVDKQLQYNLEQKREIRHRKIPWNWRIIPTDNILIHVLKV